MTDWRIVNTTEVDLIPRPVDQCEGGYMNLWSPHRSILLPLWRPLVIDSTLESTDSSPVSVKRRLRLDDGGGASGEDS